jgi:hypothetical protein
MNQRDLILNHLCSRIFERNDFESAEALIDAINMASSIPSETQWRKRKDAFNLIGEKAPMKNGGYCLTYEEVPSFLNTETDAFVEAMKSEAASKQMVGATVKSPESLQQSHRFSSVVRNDTKAHLAVFRDSRSASQAGDQVREHLGMKPGAK